MKLGMMQPYFYPYLGYWQLMNMVDEYIIYDDVNYIKRGWINRNRIKINGEASYFGISVRKASIFKKINELEVFFDDGARELLIRKVENAYGKAPYKKEVLDLLKDTLYYDRMNLAEYLAYTNRQIASYLGIKTKIYSATELGLEHTSRGQERIIDICHERGCDEYVNAIGGKELYDRNIFEKAGIDLYFLRMDPDIVYPQGKGEFIPGLSILDVLMYNDQQEVQGLMKRFTLEQ